MSDIAKIRLRGALKNYLIIDQAYSECGNIPDGIGAHMSDGEWVPGFVMSWDDFEAAYLKLKELRAKPASPKEEP